MKNFLLILIGAMISAHSHAIGTGLTYQGALEDNGAPANGVYDLQFQLKDGASNPIATRLVENVQVTAGVFSVPLDFGAVFNGQPRSMAISVRPGVSVGTFTALTPDVQVSATPYALRSTASDAADLAFGVTANSISSVNLTDDSVAGPEIAASSVDNSDLANDAVTTDKIAPDTIQTSDISDDAVSAAKLKGTFNVQVDLNATVPANACVNGDIPMAGILTSDFVFLNVIGTLPSGLFVMAQRAPSINVMRIRLCNVSAASQSFTGVPIRGSWIR